MPHRIGWAKVDGLRLYRLKLYGSEAGGGGQAEIIYSFLNRKKSPCI